VAMGNHSLLSVAISGRRRLRWLIWCRSGALGLLRDGLGLVIRGGRVDRSGLVVRGRRCLRWRTVSWRSHCSSLVVGGGCRLSRRTVSWRSHCSSLVVGGGCRLSRRTVSWRSHCSSLVVRSGLVVRDGRRLGCRTIRWCSHRSCLVDSRVLRLLFGDGLSLVDCGVLLLLLGLGDVVCHGHGGLRLRLVDRSGAGLARRYGGAGAVVILRLGLYNCKARIS